MNGGWQVAVVVVVVFVVGVVIVVGCCQLSQMLFRDPE